MRRKWISILSAKWRPWNVTLLDSWSSVWMKRSIQEGRESMRTALRETHLGRGGLVFQRSSGSGSNRGFNLSFQWELYAVNSLSLLAPFTCFSPLSAWLSLSEYFPSWLRSRGTACEDAIIIFSYPVVLKNTEVYTKELLLSGSADFYLSRILFSGKLSDIQTLLMSIYRAVMSSFTLSDKEEL